MNALTCSLRNVVSKTRRQAARRTQADPPFRPVVEQLEDRRMLVLSIVDFGAAANDNTDDTAAANTVSPMSTATLFTTF